MILTITLTLIIAVLIVICYALLVMAHDAEERADEMYRLWKEEQNGRIREEK